jgi:branched-chain amino acid transport system substrate-binding protein
VGIEGGKETKEGKKMKRWLVALLVLGLSALAQEALKVGVVVSATGPAASLGIPERNTFLMLQEMLDRTFR